MTEDPTGAERAPTSRPDAATDTAAAVPPARTTPGSTPVVFVVGDLQVAKLSVSEQDNNAYLLTEIGSGAQLLIDAADDAPRLLALIAGSGDGALGQVVTTHQHWDHHRALPQVVAATGAVTMAGAEDAGALPVATRVTLAHGDEIHLGATALQVIGLRGHTPGSVAVAYSPPDGPAHVFTGDSLFPGGVGKTHDPEAFSSLLDDVSARIFADYDDTTVIHPGHGDASDLGTERPSLPRWRERGW